MRLIIEDIVDSISNVYSVKEFHFYAFTYTL
jgi:hypothetical protein